ncbi:MAG: N-acyl homoserine lactonase family protein [Christensenellaceae bacterium]|jgi:glyoxylase-like metal-dependent hydrolase (beta-lactamase superfamily II)|nr:N-acyl homoserine lactonase family protein [Christensenellaceae bacterium]
MAATYDIYPLYLGESLQDKSGHTFRFNSGTKIRNVFYAYLIKGNGRTILVDTGICDEAFAKKHHPNLMLTAPKELDILTVLRQQHGIGTEDIDYIINTHLHWDHASNNHRFPGKKIYLQRRELHYAIDPLVLHWEVYEAPQSGIVPNWLKAANQFVLLDGSATLDEGIKVIPLPGHTDGLQGVLVDTTGGQYLLASDCVGLYENLAGIGLLPYTVAALHTDLSAYCQSMELVKKMENEQGVKIVPGHDEKVLEHKAFPLR